MPQLYVDHSRKESARLEAGRLVKQLDDLRISGRDYSFEIIIQLYSVCLDNRISVKTPSENVATSIYRFAVQQTVESISLGSGMPYGIDLISFVCHLAAILRLSVESAINLIESAAAAKARAILLQV